MLVASKDNMKIGIIGFGRFGQFLAKILRDSHQVKVFDRLNRSKQAEELGVGYVTLDVICQQELIILAVPISGLQDVLGQIKSKLKENGNIVMDICSVKEYPAKLMMQILPTNVEIIASHPMFGPDSARNGLKGLQMVFFPLRVKQESFGRVKKIFEDLGIEIIQMKPQEHDHQSALSLCLVYFIGRTLKEMEMQPQEIKITTLGFERLLKIYETVANDSQQLFEDMQNFNRYAGPARKNFLRAAQEIDKKFKPL